MSRDHTAAQMLRDLADEASDLNMLSPEEFTRVLSETIPVLALEFTHICLTVSGRCVPQFCADLRRGMLERVVSDAQVKGPDPQDLRSRVDPYSFDFPNKIEDIATRHASVALELTPDQARLLALDLACGIAYRDPDTPSLL